MNKHVVITGASSGIGLQLAKRYLEAGDNVTVVVRKASAELLDLGIDLLEGVDLTSSSSAEVIKKHFKEVRVDLLINNAGVFLNEDYPFTEDSLDQIRLQFEINSIAPLRVISALDSNLQNGSKVAMISSRMGSIEDNTSGGYYGYRMSKCALNIATVSLSKVLEERGICIGLFHPGFVKTKMTSFQGDLTPEESSRGLFKVISNLTIDNNCGYWHVSGKELPW